MAKPSPVRVQTKAGSTVSLSKRPSTGTTGGRITSSSSSSMAKPKGVISGAKTALSLASMVPGIAGAAAGIVSRVLPDGSVMHVRRKKHKGLTYNEIKGAQKLLKLVKKFAPAGHHTALKVRRARAR